MADAIRDAFLRQARASDGLGSPFTARLCRLAAARLGRETEPGRRVLGWEGDPVADALALRLAGALHGLVLEGRSEPLAAVYPPRQADDEALWSAVEAALEGEAAFVLERLALPPQTNEPRRAGALAAGLMEVAARTGLPLVTSEIGASAGLNLLWNRHRYRFGATERGDPAAAVTIAPDWEGRPPPLVPVDVAGVAGSDLHPIDLTDEAAALRLLSYVWADQADRIARTRAAIELFRTSGLAVEAADAADWVERRLAEPRRGCAHVVLHSIVWQYLPGPVQVRVERALVEAGARAEAEAPVGWLRMEPDGEEPGAAVTLTLWPGGTERLGRADYHGRWVRWG